MTSPHTTSITHATYTPICHSLLLAWLPTPIGTTVMYQARLGTSTSYIWLSPNSAASKCRLSWRPKWQSHQWHGIMEVIQLQPKVHWGPCSIHKLPIIMQMQVYNHTSQSHTPVYLWYNHPDLKKINSVLSIISSPIVINSHLRPTLWITFMGAWRNS